MQPPPPALGRVHSRRLLLLSAAGGPSSPCLPICGRIHLTPALLGLHTCQLVGESRADLPLPCKVIYKWEWSPCLPVMTPKGAGLGPESFASPLSSCLVFGTGTTRAFSSATPCAGSSPPPQALSSWPRSSATQPALPLSLSLHSPAPALCPAALAEPPALLWDGWRVMNPGLAVARQPHLCISPWWGRVTSLRCSPHSEVMEKSN